LVSGSGPEFLKTCEMAYNWYRGPEKLNQTDIGKRLGVSQQQAGKYIKHWEKHLLKLRMEIEAKHPELSDMPEGPKFAPIPENISQLTEILGYTDKPFHKEWYEFAIAMSRFLLLAPRRHAKSTCLSINYILYRIVKNPNIRILLVSNTDLQARSFVRAIKQLIEQYYPHLVPSGREKWAETAFVVVRSAVGVKEHTLSAVGVNGPIISRRQDLIVCDDVVDSENAASEQLREKVYDWFHKVLIPTLEPTGQIIIVGTPFGPDDLYARLIMDKSFPFRRYDAIVDEEKQVSLWPEVLPYVCQNGIEEAERHKGQCCLTGLRHLLGTIRFNAMYRSDPSGYSGNKLKIEWLKPFYRDLPDNLDEVVLAVDPAITERTGGDYFALATIGYSAKENLIYAMDFYRAQLTFPEQLATIVETWKAKRASRIIIESVAYQKSLAQAVQGMGLPVVPYKTVKDKVTRVLNISPYFENHTIKCKSDQDDFIHEFTQFDKGDHDDLLDAFTLGVQDILDRRFLERGQYTPQIMMETVYKSAIPESARYPVGPGTSYESPFLVGIKHSDPSASKGLSFKPGELCWTCGRLKGTCQHYPPVG
jgi:predicted phage terminase large subunit-like protein